MKRLEFLFSIVAAVALFVMMWLTVIDVVGRKFLDRSLFGAVELTEIFMMLTIYFALPLTSLAGGHIVFDLLDRMLPKAMLQWQRIAAQLLAGVVLIGAAIVVAERAGRSLEYGDTTAQLVIPLYPFHYLIALMLVITACIHFWLMVREYQGKVSHEDAGKAEGERA